MSPMMMRLMELRLAKRQLSVLSVNGTVSTPKLYRLGARGILMYPLNVVVH